MLNEISAEMLLEQLYPELTEEWSVRCKGVFYRNYSDDAMRVDPEERQVELARDGFLQLLPSSLLTEDAELTAQTAEGKQQTQSFKSRYEQMQRRLHLLSEAFMPFDTFAFRRRLRVEKQVKDLIEMKLAYVLKAYYDFDLSAEQDEYVLQAALLLPYVAKLRGNIHFVRLLLSTLTGYPVTLRLSTYSDTDNTVYGMPMVRYTLWVDGLDAAGYAAKHRQLAPLFQFIQAHFLPVDAFSEVEIKGHSIHSNLLNYNGYVR